MKFTSLLLASVSGHTIPGFDHDHVGPDVVPAFTPPQPPPIYIPDPVLPPISPPTNGLGMGGMDPMMLFFLLGDDNALKTRVEYAAICASAPATSQADCNTAIDTLYASTGDLILDCNIISDSTQKAQCLENQKLQIGTIMGFGGGSSGGLLSGLGGGDNNLLLMMLMNGGMGGMGAGMGGMLPLLLLSDGLGSSGKLDTKTLLLMMMMNGGQMGGMTQLGTMDPMMMYLLLK